MKNLLDKNPHVKAGLAALKEHGKALRKKRRELGLNRKELAEELGCSPKDIRKMETAVVDDEFKRFLGEMTLLGLTLEMCPITLPPPENDSRIIMLFSDPSEAA